jgi:hypothetical protein
MMTLTLLTHTAMVMDDIVLYLVTAGVVVKVSTR